MSCLREDSAKLSPLLDELPPAILLVDYHLDENLTGIELVRQLPASWQSAPCIIISADDSDDLKQRAALAGYTLIAKPVSADQLAALMTSLLGQIRTRLNQKLLCRVARLHFLER